MPANPAFVCTISLNSHKICPSDVEILGLRMRYPLEQACSSYKLGGWLGDCREKTGNPRTNMGVVFLIFPTDSALYVQASTLFGFC